MRHNRAANLIGPAALRQNLISAIRMVFQRWPALIIKVMQEPGNGPKLLISSQLSGIGPHASLDCKCMFPQTFRLGELS